jgi:hypothetical protein
VPGVDVQVAPHTSFVELQRLQLHDTGKKHWLIVLFSVTPQLRSVTQSKCETLELVFFDAGGGHRAAANACAR